MSNPTEPSATHHVFDGAVDAVEDLGNVVEGIVDDLVLDRIDALKVLRAGTKEQKSAVLEQIAGRGKPEQDIVSELSKLKPLWRPDRFEEAHRMAMHSLEVLDRNGARAAQLPPLGPLKPIAQYVVQQMTRWIVKGHQNTLVTRIRKLYERREANSEWGSPEHHMLRRARIDAARVEPGYKGNPLGLPTFLVGGAILSSVISGLRAFIDWAFNGGLVQGVVLASVGGLVFGFLAWAALYSAGVARHRIKLCTDQPVKALWETVGACGHPPKDGSYDFAVYAIILLALAWVLVPLAIWLVVAKLN
ncbi:MAG: hypothetical protein F2681_16650 [Actinobacteria bacterium]|uniref:Unannotated protein n=2 Tax=freshwater metagenome TaxID=449393 RepID=A0A6J7C7J7_9ZZZZ|nr:hypothetical protein [Actinomycetota bacterium]MSW79108.1 hypothetical protein [Actinomycetota bacterium]MSX56322.1 hypothetical protein [Actinomycetota bacterium]MSZ84762.1 hypothetical protein [Actinomycetota bacterium]MTB17878.1 hypothetical protein [Actinomycetota bacterium]